MNSTLKIGLKGSIVCAMLRGLASPMMAEEIHGILDNTDNLSLRPGPSGYPIGEVLLVVN